jgi:hypothetical protein
MIYITDDTTEKGFIMNITFVSPGDKWLKQE